MAAGEREQERHYDRIADAYNAHYGDAYSRRYAARFIYEPMFAGVPLGGARVLDAMCGNGECTAYVRTQGAVVTGLDISEAQIAAYETKFPDCRALRGSALDTRLPDGSVDCVAVVGGLHHVHPHVEDAVREFHRVLKPGGFLVFSEPHRGSLPDAVRTRWYKHDPLFEDNEAAIDVDDLRQRCARGFECLHESYGGQLAYLLVFNSLVFRVPPRLKSLYAPLLLFIEKHLSRFASRRLSCFVVCQWRKR